ncbi:MAG: efflux RND transporter periplasmic adaptor subunit [Anaerolineae bacterium]
MRKRLPILILIIAVGIGVYLWTNNNSAESSGLTASGTIEATDVTIAPEVNGRVLEVLAKEGETVQADQVVIHMDDSLLKAQLAQAQEQVVAAQASGKAAQANYDLLKAGAQADQILAAEQAVNNMKANVANAQAQLATLKAGARSGDIAAAEAAVAQAASQLKVMQDTYDKVTTCVTIPKPDGSKHEVCPGLGTREEQARAALNAAKEAYDAAVARLNQVKSGATGNEINAAQAKVDMALAQQAQAEAQLAQLKSGARPEQLAAAQAQIEVAQAQAAAAAAAIDVLKVQVDRLTLKAPMTGVVLKRSIEPGEVVLPGASLLKIGDLTNLYIVVYVSESRYGEIKLGQTAQVKVDSFPGETFTGKVAHIADQAEFTPRNVQTAEGRATTVFAVRLDVTNVDGKLKPGMPADVVFAQ